MVGFRKGLFLKLCGLAISGFSLSACVNLTPDMVYPLGTTQPADNALIADLNASAEETISTAKSGDIILRQGVKNAVVLTLENDVEYVGYSSLSVQKRTLDLNAGENFYVAVNLGQEPALVACSVGRPATHIPQLNPGAQASGKVCFELDPIEGEFNIDELSLDEDIYTSDQFFFVVDGAFAITHEANPYQKLTRWDPQFIYTVAPAATLRKVDTAIKGSDDAPSVALRYINSAEGAHLEPVYVTDAQAVETQADTIKINQDGEFPTIVEHDGARIELLALIEGVLAYRVLNGFDVEGPYIMDLPD